MKKVLLLLTTVFILISCSKDDETTPIAVAQTPTPNQTSVVKATVNGVSKTYNIISISEVTYTGPYAGDYIILNASIDGSSSNNIEFTITKNQTGTGAKGSITLINNGASHYDTFLGDTYELNLNVTVNNTTKITGSFSGNIGYINPNTSETTPVPVTNGTIEYYY
jgi:hypothetical protein